MTWLLEKKTARMKSLVVLYLFFGCTAFAQSGYNFCVDLEDTIIDDDVTCSCVRNVTHPDASFMWDCEQTSAVCPKDVVSELCFINACTDLPVHCPNYPEAECVYPDCERCAHAWHMDGAPVDCQGDNGCPPGQDMVACLIDPCQFATCSQHPTAVCTANYCGFCHAEFRTASGVKVLCGQTGDNGCPPGQDMVACLLDPCEFATCSQHPTAVCTANYCGFCHAEFRTASGVKVLCGQTDLPGCQSNPCRNGGTCFTGSSNSQVFVCSCPEQFTGPRCERELEESDDMMPDIPNGRCPTDRPFMNCTYQEVCSTPCAAFPSAVCTVDHCGGCTPVYLSPIGHRLNCTDGTVTECPRGVEMVQCLADPCLTATCPADPNARCVAMYCRQCHAGFFNDQGEHIDCETGQVAVCPPGFLVNNAPTDEVCATATCMLHPMALCLAKRCLRPNMTLECPYSFYGARGLPLQCTKMKLGQCPMMMMEEDEEDEGSCESECRWDSDCEDDEMCCRRGCRSVCRSPENSMRDMMTEPVLKPGTCPEPAMESGGICLQECNPEYGDVGCPRHFKCCFNGCGNICTPPLEMADSCPMSPANAGGNNNCERECENDVNCQDTEPGSKCCSHGCGTKCKKPIRAQKSGTCPVPMMRDMGQPCSSDDDNCSSDDDCQGRQKCCSNDCGYGCIGPQEEPGECPHSPSVMAILAGVAHACSSDADCRGISSKCCAYGCGQICVEPVKEEKPGVCPRRIVGSSRRPCNKVCSGDHDCPGNKKCCDDGCACSIPEDKSGMCPMVPKQAGACVEMCSMDQDCPGSRKCCSNGCGHVCTAPNVEKPGMCPMPPRGNNNNGPCMELCSGDQDCPGVSRCCSNGCGSNCSAPRRSEMPGACPLLPASDAGICVQECGPESRCPGRNEKCCFNGCGHDCRRPMPIECEGDGLSEICEDDPCDQATCPSEPDAICVASTCGRCRPRFFLDDEEVTCQGQQLCRGLGDRDAFESAGTTVDSSDGCNRCNVFQVTMRLNGTFENVMNRQDQFIGKMKRSLSMRYGLHVTSMRDFKVRRGSIIVEFKVTSDDTTGTVDLEGIVMKMESEVMTGQFIVVFEGETLRADPDFFEADPVDTSPIDKKKPYDGTKDLIVYIIIGAICGLFILIIVVAVIVCAVKSHKAKAKREKSTNMEFNDYSSGKENKAFAS